MPYTIGFVANGSGVLFQGSGVLTEHEIVEAQSALKSDAQTMQGVVFALIDLKDVVELRLDYAGVGRLASMNEPLAKLAPHMAVAIVAPADHIFGIARMWAAVAQRTGWPIRVGRSRPEAEEWIAAMKTGLGTHELIDTPA